MVLFAALEEKKQELIRKAQGGSIFLAKSSAAAITTLTTGSSAALQALPTDYTDMGLITKDGSTYGRTTETSEIMSFGSVEPSRTDVTKDVITLACTFQETKLETIGLYTGADIAAIQAASVTGELKIDKPDRPGFRYYRALGLYVDDGDDGEIYLGRWMPRVRVTEFGEQQFVDGDQAVQYPVTLTGYKDSTLGTSHSWLFAGPGWKALLTKMGIPQAT